MSIPPISKSFKSNDFKPLRVWAVVLSRKGSQRLPNKALLTLGNKPMAGWYLEALSLASSLERRFIFSDDDVLNNYCKTAFGTIIEKPPFERPTHLSDASAGSFETLRWFVAQWPEAERPDALLLGQLTTPFTQAEDIDAAVDIYARHHTEGSSHCIISVTEPLKPASWLMHVTPDGTVRKLPQSNAPLVYPNGAMYIMPTSFLMEQNPVGLTDFKAVYHHLMPWVRSVDIDTAEDLAMAQALLHQHQHHSANSKPVKHAAYSNPQSNTSTQPINTKEAPHYDDVSAR